MSLLRKRKSISVEEMGKTLAEFTWLSFRDCLELKEFPEARRVLESIENISESQFHIELLIFHMFTAICTCRGNVKPHERFNALVTAYRESIFERIKDEYPELAVSRRFQTLVDTRELEYSKTMIDKDGPKALEVLGQLVMSKMLGRNVMNMKLIVVVPIWYAVFAKGVAELLGKSRISLK